MGLICGGLTLWLYKWRLFEWLLISLGKLSSLLPVLLVLISPSEVFHSSWVKLKKTYSKLYRRIPQWILGCWRNGRLHLDCLYLHDFHGFGLLRRYYCPKQDEEGRRRQERARQHSLFTSSWSQDCSLWQILTKYMHNKLISYLWVHLYDLSL